MMEMEDSDDEMGEEEGIGMEDRDDELDEDEEEHEDKRANELICAECDDGGGSLLNSTLSVHESQYIFPF